MLRLKKNPNILVLDIAFLCLLFFIKKIGAVLHQFMQKHIDSKTMQSLVKQHLIHKWFIFSPFSVLTEFFRTRQDNQKYEIKTFNQIILYVIYQTQIP